ncbi:YjbF family lipoprotein [Roseivivax sediminis]|uniref:Group 4 capsule polysaccharide lipoprotein gfcB, YjbF n=1 Tax=Roseivivax sediminis TaxID=936889 RepID=A0A1I2CW52_9RHOB|nr:YjbF family lipoprotein [Roseivivax sediminis]SFE72541.1 Group 4 capsule polysaccharide lipoprotein gfcB, YjbF [Roseivivax sediminis]
MKRRYALAFALSAVLAGCSSTGEPQRFARDTARHLLPFLPIRSDPRYAALVRADAPTRAATEEATERTITLRRASTLPDGAVLWLAPDGAGFTFRGGLLVATRGLGDDLMSTDVSDLAALMSAGEDGLAERFQSRLDGEGQTVLESYVCTVTVSGMRVSEDCTGMTEDFVNTYRIVPESGAVLSSRQHPRAGSGAWRFGDPR